MKVIIANGNGEFEIYPATLANAKEILSWYIDRVPNEVKGFAERAKGCTVVSKETVIRILENILNRGLGENASKSIIVTQELVTEVVLFLFANKVKIEYNPTGFANVDSYDFFQKCDMRGISCFRALWPNTEGNKSILVEKWVMDWAKKYDKVVNDTFSEDTSEIQKVYSIMDFVNQFTHRGIKYGVVEVEEKA